MPLPLTSPDTNRNPFSDEDNAYSQQLRAKAANSLASDNADEKSVLSNVVGIPAGIATGLLTGNPAAGVAAYSAASGLTGEAVDASQGNPNLGAIAGNAAKAQGVVDKTSKILDATKPEDKTWLANLMGL